MKKGKFDNLTGRGQPIEIDSAPAEENARLLWWALRILKNNDVTPDEVRWRKAIELMKAELEFATTESHVRGLVAQINLLVRKLNTLGTNAMSGASAVTAVSVELELQKLSERPA